MKKKLLAAIVADLAGMVPGANQSVVVTIDGGSAIVYGATIYNATGNGTLQVATRTQE